MRKTVKRQEEQEAIRQLKKILRPGAVIYSILRHRSASGMSRRIDFYVFKGNRPIFLSGYMSTALGYTLSTKGGLVVSGCGMDMGWHLAYSLGRVLFPKGFIPAKAGLPGRNGTPADQLDTDGGYAIRHDWL